MRVDRKGSHDPVVVGTIVNGQFLVPARGQGGGAAVVGAISTLIGLVIADTASQESKAGVNGFAAGALLVVLIDSMTPEASRTAGRTAGLTATLGFAVGAGLWSAGT